MKRLFRSKTSRYLGGVCGGLGVYSNIDPVFWRILFFFGWIFSVIIPFSLIYILMWIIVPIEKTKDSVKEFTEYEFKTPK